MKHRCHARFKVSAAMGLFPPFVTVAALLAPAFTIGNMFLCPPCTCIHHLERVSLASLHLHPPPGTCFFGLPTPASTIGNTFLWPTYTCIHHLERVSLASLHLHPPSGTCFSAFSTPAFHLSNSPYYPVVGIEHRGKRWMFPEDRGKRRDAPTTMVKGIASEGLSGRKYGTGFWTQMQIDYEKMLGSAQTTDKTVSAAVGEFSQLEEAIRFTLQALLYVLRGNYQDTYQQVYKAWGLRK